MFARKVNQHIQSRGFWVRILVSILILRLYYIYVHAFFQSLSRTGFYPAELCWIFMIVSYILIKINLLNYNCWLIDWNRATSGDKVNNKKFSPCSLDSINKVLEAKARGRKGCFKGKIILFRLLYHQYNQFMSQEYWHVLMPICNNQLTK